MKRANTFALAPTEAQRNQLLEIAEIAEESIFGQARGRARDVESLPVVTGVRR